MLRIGYHLSVAGSLDLAFDRGHAIDCTAMQIFVSNPRGWEIKIPSKEISGKFIEKHDRYDIDAVCHMPYLPNLASSNPDTHRKSMDSFKGTISICSSLGIKYLITHLGSHLGEGNEIGLRNVVKALDAAANHAEGKDVMILLENQAGHKNSIGARLEDLAWIYDNSSLAEQGGLGFCLDTCHLFAAGYDIRKKEVLSGMDSVLDFSRVHALHVNDAKFELGSGKDRHENIGKGFIGLKGFDALLNYGKIKEKILVLETPENAELAPGEEMEAIRKEVKKQS